MGGIIQNLSLAELKALRLNHRDNPTMEGILSYVIENREAEIALIALEEEYQLWQDYRHCCGGW